MSNLHQLKASEAREAYLLKVTRRLQTRLSPLAAYEEVGELREHLDAMAAAYEELGMAPETAMCSAIAKFGPAEKIGGELAKVGSAPQPGIAMRATLFLGLFAGQTLFAAALIAVFDTIHTATFGGAATFDVECVIGAVIALVVSTVSWNCPRLRPLTAGFLWVGVHLTVMTYIYWWMVSVGLGSHVPFLVVAHSIMIFLLGSAGSFLAGRIRILLAWKASNTSPLAR